MVKCIAAGRLRCCLCSCFEGKQRQTTTPPPIPQAPSYGSLPTTYAEGARPTLGPKNEVSSAQTAVGVAWCGGGVSHYWRTKWGLIGCKMGDSNLPKKHTPRHYVPEARTVAGLAKVIAFWLVVVRLVSQQSCFSSARWSGGGPQRRYVEAEDLQEWAGAEIRVSCESRGRQIGHQCRAGRAVTPEAHGSGEGRFGVKRGTRL